MKTHGYSNGSKSILYQRKKYFDDKIKNYQMKKVLRPPHKFAKSQELFKVPKAPFHTVMGMAYIKTKNGSPYFCGGLIRN